MKPTLPLSIFHCCKTLSRAFVLLLMVSLSFQIKSSAQCAANYTSASLNWDNMEYFHRNGTYYNGNNPVTGTQFITTAMAQTQYFAFGTNKLTISTTIPVGSYAPGSVTSYGEVIEHTGETGAYGTGADIKFMPPNATAVTLTLTFASEVRDVKFSIFDLDNEMSITTNATNTAGIAQSITYTKPAGATPGSNIRLGTVSGSTVNTIATISGTNVIADWPVAGGAGTDYAVSSNAGTVNVDIAGPVKTITLTIKDDNNTRTFYLSDITACTPNPGFPSSYYSPYTTPFTNQPAYFLANPQNLNMYMVNASTGVAEFIFADPGGNAANPEGSPAGTNKMNSIAYDPIRHWIYYVMDNATNYPGNLVLKKYDVSTQTISTVIPNLNTFGIPSFIQGVEYAAAAFYDTSLYLGIEYIDGVTYTSNCETVVWRIDINTTTGTPTGYCQVFGTPGDNGGPSGSALHDWGDFVIKDGTLITHGTAGTILVPTNNYIHYDMMSGASTSYAGGSSVAGQLGQTHNGNVYKIDSVVYLYNNNGTVTSVGAVSVSSCSPAWYKANARNAAGDASDPFKPMCDFGDAPVSYDPVALTVAANQKACNNSTLRIGSAWGDEWSKNTSTTDASGDDEEDGIGTVTVMVSDGAAYNHVQEVVVLNNTGADAYLAGWLDYDADGLFEASEGVVMTVSSSASPQTISLLWSGITIASGTPNSFLRVRLSSSVLTSNNSTGWFSDGETEDYPVLSQAIPLTIQLLDLSASLTRDKNVLLNWKAYADDDALGFEIQRSNDQNTWEKIGWVDINKSAFTADYNFTDLQPLQGKSYYRLKMVEQTGSSRYSPVRLIQLDQLITRVKIYPNPAKKDVTVSFNSSVDQSARLIIRSTAGVTVISKTISLKKGENTVQLSTLGLSNGLYLVELSASEKTFINRLTVAH